MKHYLKKERSYFHLNVLLLRFLGRKISCTSPPCMSFMLKPSLPFFPFLFFFFLQQHFLMMQKQHVRTSNAATTAIAIKAHGGTVSFSNRNESINMKNDLKRLFWCHFLSNKEFFVLLRSYSRGILSISFKNLLLISSNMSFLLISVLLEPEVSAAVVDIEGGEGAMVTVVTLVGSAAATA